MPYTLDIALIFAARAAGYIFAQLTDDVCEWFVARRAERVFEGERGGDVEKEKCVVDGGKGDSEGGRRWGFEDVHEEGVGVGIGRRMGVERGREGGRGREVLESM